MSRGVSEAAPAECVRILIVDDEESLRLFLERIVSKATPYIPVPVASAEEALQKVKAGGINVVITDLVMPGMGGERLLEEIKRFNPSLPVIILTSHATVECAVELLKKGASDYITKPFQTQLFLNRLEKVMENLRLRREVELLRERLVDEHGLGEGDISIIGNSSGILILLNKLPAVARSEVTVLLRGESGTGKELFARAIHSLSSRRGRPFVTVNCGALPDTLLENELFGHVRGAYSDAVSDQPGMIETAEGGTLFLDEIGEMSPGIQVKLLRFLQFKEYKPLGSTRIKKADVRIIVATNRNLQKEVEEGRFREDLYYRINIIPLEIPPLRERKEDIPLLVSHFLKKYSDLHNGKVEGISPMAMQRLMEYDWPGNVRELENKIQQLVVMSPTSIIDSDVLELEGPEAWRRNPEDASGELEKALRRFVEKGVGRSEHEGGPRPLKDAKRQVVELFERTYIEKVLGLAGGNISRAARLAGKHRRAFWELMRKYGIGIHGMRNG